MSFVANQDVWVYARGAWRHGTVIKSSVANEKRAQVRVVTNAAGNVVTRWFGGNLDGGWPVYPGTLTDPVSYTCTEARCPLHDQAVHGHPGMSATQLREAHERNWHNKIKNEQEEVTPQRTTEIQP